MGRPPAARRRSASLAASAAACALVLACAGFAAPAGADTSGATQAPASGPGSSAPAKPASAVTLEQCIASSSSGERTATFTGEMSAIPGASKMEMRFDLLERLPHETSFHVVTNPGLGIWRSAAANVKIYKYIKQVTNLSAPATYRASVRFRWLNAKGHIMKSAELRTPRCEQPLAPRSEGGAPEAGAQTSTALTPAVAANAN